MYSKILQLSGHLHTPFLTSMATLYPGPVQREFRSGPKPVRGPVRSDEIGPVEVSRPNRRKWIWQTTVWPSSAIVRLTIAIVRHLPFDHRPPSSAGPSSAIVAIVRLTIVRHRPSSAIFYREQGGEINPCRKATLPSVGR